MNLLILGSTFKEDCPDFRNSKVFEIMDIFLKKRINFSVSDPFFSEEKIQKKYHKYFIDFKINDQNKYDVILVAVSHSIYKKIGFARIKKVAKKNSIFFDLKSVFNSKDKKVISL